MINKNNMLRIGQIRAVGNALTNDKYMIVGFVKESDEVTPLDYREIDYSRVWGLPYIPAIKVLVLKDKEYTVWRMGAYLLSDDIIAG
jgi:hypothetical protein